MTMFGFSKDFWKPVPRGDNPPMAQSTAERQRVFKQAMKESGYVRLDAYVTKEQREKFRDLGGDEWLRKAINRARIPEQK